MLSQALCDQGLAKAIQLVKHGAQATGVRLTIA